MLFAKGNHAFGPLHGHAGPLRARSIVNAGMNDAAVVSGLMLGDVGFLLKDRDGEPAVPLRQCARRGKADNAPPIMAMSIEGFPPMR